MPRYIDAENMYKEVWKRSTSPLNEWDTWGVLNVLDMVKTEDVAPVVHAHWIEFEDYSGTVYPECSRCGLVWWLEEGTAEENEMYYCPKCGAKMDEKEGQR